MARAGRRREKGRAALAAFEAHLKERGGRLTRPRRAALRALLRLRGSFTCEDVERAIRRSRAGGAHRATVYRLLPQLVAAGLLRETSLGRKGLVRYERATDGAGAGPDARLVCARCGRSEGVRAPGLAAAAARLVRRRRFRPGEPVVTLRGVCPACRAPAKRRGRRRRKGRGKRR